MSAPPCLNAYDGRRELVCLLQLIDSGMVIASSGIDYHRNDTANTTPFNVARFCLAMPLYVPIITQVQYVSSDFGTYLYRI